MNPAIKTAINIVGSQKKLGAACEVSQQAVYKWLHNKAKVSPEHVGSEACIRMRSLIRGNQTRTTGWLPTCIRTCGPMRLLMRNYAVRPQMSLSI